MKKNIFVFIICFIVFGCKKDMGKNNTKQEHKVLYIINGTPSLSDKLYDFMVEPPNYNMHEPCSIKMFFSPKIEKKFDLSNTYVLKYKGYIIDQVVMVNQPIKTWRESENIFESILGGPCLEARGIDIKNWEKIPL